jgi:hypothetical protein
MEDEIKSGTLSSQTAEFYELKSLLCQEICYFIALAGAMLKSYLCEL